MKPMELFRRAVAEISDAPGAGVSPHLEKKHGVKIDPAFIPVYRATLEQLERTEKLCQDAKPIVPKEPSTAR